MLQINKVEADDANVLVLHEMCVLGGGCGAGRGKGRRRAFFRAPRGVFSFSLTHSALSLSLRARGTVQLYGVCTIYVEEPNI